MILKYIRKIIFIFISIIIIPKAVYATNTIIESQLESLNLSSFIKAGEKYTKDSFKSVDISNLLNSAVKGKLETKGIYKSVLNILGWI